MATVLFSEAAAAAGSEPGAERLEATESTLEPTSELQPIYPQRLLRLASVTHEVLEEARHLRPPAAVEHLRRLHRQILRELRASLPADLFDELTGLAPEVEDGALGELVLAHAEILGWLEGLFQGTQLAMQLETIRAMQHLRAPPPSSWASKRAEREEGPYL
jgi:hypothetical protein